MGVLRELFILIIIIGVPILWFAALISILRNNFKDSSTKVVWIIAVIFLPGLGAILYFLIGKKQIVPEAIEKK